MWQLKGTSVLHALEGAMRSGSLPPQVNLLGCLTGWETR